MAILNAGETGLVYQPKNVHPLICSHPVQAQPGEHVNLLIMHPGINHWRFGLKLTFSFRDNAVNRAAGVIIMNLTHWPHIIMSEYLNTICSETIRLMLLWEEGLERPVCLFFLLSTLANFGYIYRFFGLWSSDLVKRFLGLTVHLCVEMMQLIFCEAENNKKCLKIGKTKDNPKLDRVQSS